MKQIPLVLLMVCLATLPCYSGENQGMRLSRQERQFLDEFLDLKPGLTEEELRQWVPDLSPTYKDKDTHEQTISTSSFWLAGMEWRGRVTLVEGKVQKTELRASAMKEDYVNVREQRMPQARVRAIGLLIAGHYTRKFWEVSDYYVPNTDCPAGNPFGLRQQWHVKDMALAVEFSKNSSTSAVQISLADWAAWDKEGREWHEKSWPLKPAPKALLMEASSR